MMTFILLYFALYINNNPVYSLEIPFVSDISQVIAIARDAQDIANGNYPLKSLLKPSPNPLNVALEIIYDITMQINAFTSTVSNELDNVLETIVHRLPQDVRNLHICENPRGFPTFYKFLISPKYTFGIKTECDHWTGLDRGQTDGIGVGCPVCLCACDQEGGKVNGTYAFNLQPQLADIKNNSIVTNVRFVRENNMIYIQIEESQLLVDGNINENSTSWKPHENIKFECNDDGGNFTLHLSDSSTVLEKDVDYAYITLEQDTLNLDTVHVPPGYVITRVRLNHVTPRDGLSPIQLEIHATQFNYQTGELLQSEENPSIWITPMTSTYHPREDQIKRQKINYGRAIYNKDQSIKHEVSLMSNRYVQFRRSSVYYDAGQSTVPFFDTRPASGIEKIPLDGIGIIYRENSDYAGFLALKMHGIDTSQSLRPGIKKEDLKLYRENYNTKLAYNPVVI